MKSIILVVLILTLLQSCQKEIELPVTPNPNERIEENGNLWQGFRISNPVNKFDAVADRIFVEDSMYNDAAVKFAGKNLPNTGPRIVYAVQSFTAGNFEVQKADLIRRGWKIAPLSYLIALAKEYGLSWNGGYLWNLFCLDAPAKVNFGSGDEYAAVTLSPNIWNGNYQYNMAIRSTPFSSQYSSISILAYK